MTAFTHILGVDPGLKGAFCLYEIWRKKILLWDMPVVNSQVDPTHAARVVRAAKAIAWMETRIHAVIENVNSMPRQAGAFNFGRSVGVVHGVLGALDIPYTLISPNEWKGAMGLRRLANETDAQNKTRARGLAIELWPSDADQFKRVKDDGRAEAALLARYFANKVAK